MIYRFFLDSTLIDEPIGTGGLIDSIRRDRNLRGVLRTQDATISFIGSGYRYLKNLWDQSYDSEASCIIQSSDDDGFSWKPYYAGIVFCAEIEWTEIVDNNGIAKVKIQDNSFNARINNNKSIKIFPQGGKSKTGVAITPPTIFDYDQIKKNPKTGAIYVNQVTASPFIWKFYKVADVLEYMVKWMSDDEVAFSCDDLTNGWVGGVSTQTQYLTITTGRQIRKSYDSGFNANDADFISTWPGLDFDTLLKSVCKIGGYTFFIDYTQSKPTFTLSTETDFRDTTTLARLSGIEEIKTKTDVANIYSKIAFGSSSVTNGNETWAGFPERAPLIGWNQEEFVINTRSNIDKTLDYKLEFMVSSNNVQDLFENYGPAIDDGLDKDFLLLMGYTSGGNWYPTQTDWIGGGSGFFFFNELLCNNYILQRNLTGVPNSIFNQLDTTSHLFSVEKSSDGGHVAIHPTDVDVVEPIPYNDDSTPPMFNTGTTEYNTTTHRFECTVGGNYSFFTLNKIRLDNSLIGNFNINAKCYINRYDSGSVLINSYLVDDQTYRLHSDGITINEIVIDLGGSANMNLVATDLVQVSIRFECFSGVASGHYRILAHSNFQCISDSSGGNYSIINEDDFAAFRHEFQYALTNQQWKTILDNPKGLIEFSMSGQKVRKGWIEEIKNPVTGNAKIILNSTKKLNP